MARKERKRRYISEYMLEDYIFWDDVLKRYDLKTRAFIEQTDPKVRILVDLVLRSWFIPVDISFQTKLAFAGVNSA